LGDLIDSIQNDVLEPFELTPSDYGVLASLRRAGRPYALSPSQLHGQLRRSSGGMTKILKRLEESGLVERKSDLEDGRKIRVTLTPRGLSLHDRVFRAFAAVSNRLLADLSNGQKTEIDRALKQLHEQMEGLGNGPDS
jgi:DNA-binding MarR family transcriptional regulator